MLRNLPKREFGRGLLSFHGRELEKKKKKNEHIEEALLSEYIIKYLIRMI
jgi:hypothetical protein